MVLDVVEGGVAAALALQMVEKSGNGRKRSAASVVRAVIEDLLV